MATQTQTLSRPEQDQNVEKNIQQLRELFADAPEIGKKALENALHERSYRYTLVSGVPASHYAGVIDVKPKASGSVAEWRVDFLANNQPDIVARTMVTRLVETGLGSLKNRFGVPYDDARRA